MFELGLLFGLFAATALVLVIVLLRRGNGPTENADGLLIEQQRRTRAQQDRIDYSPASVHNSLTGMTDHRRP